MVLTFVDNFVSESLKKSNIGSASCFNAKNVCGSKKCIKLRSEKRVEKKLKVSEKEWKLEGARKWTLQDKRSEIFWPSVRSRSRIYPGEREHASVRDLARTSDELMCISTDECINTSVCNNATVS